MSIWHLISFFGDTSFLFPTAILISLWLAIAGQPRLALLWTALYAIAMGTVAATKIAFMGWGIGLPQIDFTGISGHTAFSTTVFPILFRLTLFRRPPNQQTAGFYMGYLSGFLIGVSRIYLKAHSTSEVVAGFILGLATSYLFLLQLRDTGPIKIHGPFQAGTSILLCAALLFSPAPTQRLLQSFSLYLAGISLPCSRAIP